MKAISYKLIHLPIWWYKNSLVAYQRLFRNLLIFLDNKLAVSLMLRMMLVPMFHDKSFLGRILSLLFRLVRTVVGGLIIFVTILAIGFWLIIWLVLPFLLLAIGPIGWLLLIIFWLVSVYKQLNKPLKLHKDIKLQPSKIKNYLSKETALAFKQANNNSQSFLFLLLKERRVLQLLQRIEITPETVLNIKPNLIIREWLVMAAELAIELKDEVINSSHLMLALLKNENFRFKEALETIKWLKQKKYWAKTPFLWEKEYVVRPIGGVDRAWTGIPTPTLDRYGKDLTKKAQKAQLPEMFGKKKISEQIIKILSRKQQDNVMVIGEPGSGKSTLVKGIAQEIVRGVKAKSLRFKRLIALDISKLVAGANNAELNHRINTIIDEIVAAENIILFIDEVHHLASVNKNTPETSELFRALEPHLSEGEFQFIGATTTENYKKYIEPNEAFARLFETVELEEASIKDTLEVLKYLSFRWEVSEKVIITTRSLNSIIKLSKQLIHNRVFPDKAVNLLDEVVAIVKAKENRIVTTAEVEKLVSEKTKVPVSQIDKEEAEILLNIEKKLHQRVVGQDEAIKAISSAIRRARTGLKNLQKPIASFMFSGPTGVGKTETAKALAAEFFGSEKIMIRLDMSEYQNLDSINRLIGAPSKGNQINQGGQLTEAVKQQPYALVLLDEIEKAHPKILNLFLQVLDDARLTDSQGKVVDFSNTIIIATTNIGTRSLTKGVKKSKVLAELEAHYAPEFLNRFTGLIMFNNLNPKEIKQIIKIKLNQLTDQLKKQEIEVKFDLKVIDQLAELGFSTKWGGRQVDRVIQEKIMNLIAEKILKGEIKKRSLFEINEVS